MCYLQWVTKCCPENGVYKHHFESSKVYRPVIAPLWVSLHWKFLLLLWCLQGFFYFCAYRNTLLLYNRSLPAWRMFALHLADLWLFPHFSQRWCAIGSYYLFSFLTRWWWELMLLREVCFVKIIVQPTGNILKEFKIKIILHQIHRFDCSHIWHIFLSGQKRKKKKRKVSLG